MFAIDSAQPISESTLTQHRFAVKAMAPSQANYFSDSIQSGGGPILPGTNITTGGGDFLINCTSSGIANEDR